MDIDAIDLIVKITKTILFLIFMVIVAFAFIITGFWGALFVVIIVGGVLSILSN